MKPQVQGGMAAAARPLDLARALVATPSVNPHLDPGGDGESAVAAMVAGWLTSWGFATAIDEAAPGRPSLVAELRGRRPGPTLLLNGHLDTVGVEGMTVSPFEADVRDGRLYGRGACDMKGGIASALAAAAAIAAEGLEAGSLLLAFTADEENASVGMARLIERGLRADAAIVCEPTELRVAPAHKGFAWAHLGFRGRAAHGSRPDLGVDAVHHAGLFLSGLDRLTATLESRPPHPLLGHGSVHAGTIRGGTAPSVYPAHCSLTIERRTLPSETGEDVRAELLEVLAGLRSRDARLDASLEIGLYRPGSEIDDDAPLVEGLRETAGLHGREAAVAGVSAWVEAALLNRAGVPSVCFGPGSMADAHAAEESCDVAQIEDCTRILTAFTRRFLAGD